MADLDPTLIEGLKRAKGGKEMFFAFVPKAPDGELIVSKKKIPPKEIAALRKEIGGGTPVVGKCTGPFDNMVFKVAKMSATLGPAIKKVAKRKSGFTIIPEIKLAKEAELEEEEGEEPEVAAAVVASKPPEAAVEAAPEVSTAPEQEAELDLSPWHTARLGAIKDLRALAAKVAATKHGTAKDVLQEINGIIKKLPSDPKPDQLDSLAKLIRTDDGIDAAEETPSHFHEVNIRKPLLDALDEIKVTRYEAKGVRDKWPTGR